MHIYTTAMRVNSSRWTFELTMKPYKQLVSRTEKTTWIELRSFNGWIDDATVEEDIDVSTIEKKTWGASAVLKNIHKAFYNTTVIENEVVSTIKFNVFAKK